jgi:hypothetical protein
MLPRRRKSAVQSRRSRRAFAKINFASCFKIIPFEIFLFKSILQKYFRVTPCIFAASVAERTHHSLLINETVESD